MTLNKLKMKRTGSFLFLILKGRDLRRVVTDQTSLVLHLCLRVEPLLSPLVSNIPTLKIRAWRWSLLTHSLHSLLYLRHVLCIQTGPLYVGAFIYIKVNSHFPLANANPYCQWVFIRIKCSCCAYLSKAFPTAWQNYCAIKMLMHTQCFQRECKILEGRNLFCP